MGVRKFRSVADMPGRPARAPLDPENLHIACELIELTERLHSTPRRAGVRKFRSYDEAYQARQSEGRDSE